MSSFSRVGREYVAQLVAFAVAVADRLFIPAILLRQLGVTSFSTWSIAIACGAFVSALEFGTTRFYTNRLINLVEKEKNKRARYLYRQGIAFTFGLTALAFFLTILFLPKIVSALGDDAIGQSAYNIVIPVILAAATLQILSLRQALYRAHRNFAFETWLRLAGEIGRISAVTVGAAAGLSLVAICWLWFGATLLFIFVPISFHTRRIYAGYSDFPVTKNGIRSIRNMGSVAIGLWLQNLCMTLFTTIPILAIGAITQAPAIIAQFVLMRTIANFVRQVLQMFANVFGIELARRNAQNDHENFAAVFNEANRFLATQTAVASAALIVLAEPLFTLWTGEPELFDQTILILAILPPLLAPSIMLTIEAFAYTNNPWPVVYARLAQFGLTVIAFLSLGDLEIAMRMMAALLIGEVLGLAVPLIFAMKSMNSLITPWHSVRLLLISASAFAVTFAIVYFANFTAAYGVLVNLTAGLTLSAIAFLIVMGTIGMSSERRRQLAAQISAYIKRR